jgi:hypothetical protein
MDSKTIWREVFFEGINNSYSICDMFYMVVTRRNDGVLITNDLVLVETCKRNTNGHFSKLD